jgi:hypothetical protein
MACFDDSASLYSCKQGLPSQAAPSQQKSPAVAAPGLVIQSDQNNFPEALRFWPGPSPQLKAGGVYHKIAGSYKKYVREWGEIRGLETG